MRVAILGGRVVILLSILQSLYIYLYGLMGNFYILILSKRKFETYINQKVSLWKNYKHLIKFVIKFYHSEALILIWYPRVIYSVHTIVKKYTNHWIMHEMAMISSKEWTHFMLIIWKVVILGQASKSVVITT